MRRDRRLRRLPRRVPRRDPDGVLSTFEREYPYGWLGILAEVAPSNDELVYAHHERGFALLSLRSPELSRATTSSARPTRTSTTGRTSGSGRSSSSARRSTAGRSHEGPILEKGVTGMRSFVAEPMQHGRLFLAGDAAHIVPPTGAKGLNLAIADVRAARRGARRLVRDRLDRPASTRYSDACLRRVWRAEHFSWWMTSMLHRHDGRRSVRLEAAAVAAALRHVVRGGGDGPRRELRRAHDAVAGSDPRRPAPVFVAARGRGGLASLPRRRSGDRDHVLAPAGSRAVPRVRQRPRRRPRSRARLRELPGRARRDRRARVRRGQSDRPLDSRRSDRRRDSLCRRLLAGRRRRGGSRREAGQRRLRNGRADRARPHGARVAPRRQVEPGGGEATRCESSWLSSRSSWRCRGWPPSSASSSTACRCSAGYSRPDATRQTSRCPACTTATTTGSTACSSCSPRCCSRARCRRCDIATCASRPGSTSR